MDKKVVEVNHKHITVCDKYTAIQRALHECRIAAFGMVDKVDSDEKKIKITVELVDLEGEKDGKKNKGEASGGAKNKNSEGSNGSEEESSEEESSEIDDEQQDHPLG
jgi:hypothetical protein